MVGVSTSAIQRIELGQLLVSVELAERLAAATGAAPASLRRMHGNPLGRSGAPYSRADFDLLRKRPAAPNAETLRAVSSSAALVNLRRALEAAGQDRKLELFERAFARWLRRAKRNFGLRFSYRISGVVSSTLSAAMISAAITRVAKLKTKPRR